MVSLGKKRLTADMIQFIAGIITARTVRKTVSVIRRLYELCILRFAINSFCSEDTF